MSGDDQEGLATRKELSQKTHLFLSEENLAVHLSPDSKRSNPSPTLTSRTVTATETARKLLNRFRIVTARRLHQLAFVLHDETANESDDADDDAFATLALFLKQCVMDWTRRVLGLAQRTVCVARTVLRHIFQSPKETKGCLRSSPGVSTMSSTSTDGNTFYSSWNLSDCFVAGVLVLAPLAPAAVVFQLFKRGVY